MPKFGFGRINKELERIMGLSFGLGDAVKKLGMDFIFSSKSVGELSKNLSKATDISDVFSKVTNFQVRDLWELTDVYGYTSKAASELAAKTGWLRAARRDGVRGLDEQIATNLELITELERMNKLLPEQFKKVQKYTRIQKKWTRFSLSMLGTMFGLQNLSKLYTRTLGRLVTSSQAWAYYQQDINFSLEDMSDILMEEVEPRLGSVINFLEGIVTSMEGWHPWIKEAVGWMVILGQSALDSMSLVADTVVSFSGIFAGLNAMAAENIPIFSKLSRSILRVFTNTLSAISSLGSSIASFVSTAGSKILDFFALMTRTIYAKVVPAIAFMKANVVSLAIGVAALVATFLIVDQLLSALPEQLRRPVGAIVALIGGIVAATVAWLAFHGTMTAGVAIPIIMAAVGAGIAGIKAMVPSYQGLRGSVQFGEPSTIRVHPGETLTGKTGRKKYQPKEVPETLTVDVTGLNVEEAFHKALNAAVREISERMDRKYRRREY